MTNWFRSPSAQQRDYVIRTRSLDLSLTCPQCRGSLFSRPPAGDDNLKEGYVWEISATCQVGLDLPDAAPHPLVVAQVVEGEPPKVE
jgi:hypothetical protein